MQFKIWRHDAMHVKSGILSCHAVQRLREGFAIRGLLIWINKTLIPDFDQVGRVGQLAPPARAGQTSDSSSTTNGCCRSWPNSGPLLEDCARTQASDKVTPFSISRIARRSHESHGHER